MSTCIQEKDLPINFLRVNDIVCSEWGVVKVGFGIWHDY